MVKLQKPLLVIVLGPTAVGKTSVAIALAKKFQTCIISADSRQFYKEIPIGTAQPSQAELNSVQHYFIADNSIANPIDAGAYGREARKILEHEFQNHSVIIMAGGSGLYIDAVVNGFDPLPDADVSIREELQKTFEEIGIEPLQEELQKLDPEFCEEIDRNNPSRLIRAIEVCRLTGKKYSELRVGKTETLPFNVLKIGLDLPREELYGRINERVELMMENGLEKEARSVFAQRKMNALQTVGYKELFDYFDGTITLERAVELIRQHSRNYAKRQLTWWRRDAAIIWFKPSEISAVEELIINNVQITN
ncbi:MAG: tRNA (adenosine(37)-N6)-dimethylallyltransferase MiaA [Bacteroidota bacterium]|nr:tRNA (adenosine(37)-N6)-dimethylallyltransferase MiaA [Bacteroidota bacterium]